MLIYEAEKIDRVELDLALTQTWEWSEAVAVVLTCPYAVIVSDMHGHMLRPKDRLANLQNVPAAVLKVAPPAAVHWPNSQCIVDPGSLAREFAEGNFGSIFCGAVNVRMYNVAATERDFVMDTLGMAAFGLPDQQCHYHSIEPKDVAGFRYNLAHYIFDKGAVIETGHSVDGCNGAVWQCSYEWSLVEPKRELIDVHPGQFAAGNR